MGAFSWAIAPVLHRRLVVIPEENLRSLNVEQAFGKHGFSHAATHPHHVFAARVDPRRFVFAFLTVDWLRRRQLSLVQSPDQIDSLDDLELSAEPTAISQERNREIVVGLQGLILAPHLLIFLRGRYD